MAKRPLRWIKRGARRYLKLSIFPYILRFVVQERVKQRLIFHQNTVVCKYLTSLVVKRRRQAKNIPCAVLQQKISLLSAESVSILVGQRALEY